MEGDYQKPRVLSQHPLEPLKGEKTMSTDIITMVRSVEESIEMVEFNRDRSFHESMKPSQAIKAAAQSKIAGVAGTVQYVGDISWAAWKPEHKSSLDATKSWVITNDGAALLKRGYQLVVSVTSEGVRGHEFGLITEDGKKHIVTVLVRKNWIRSMLDRKYDGYRMTERQVFDVLGLKRYWK